MLFDLKPKEVPRELFGRETELDRMVELLKAGNWVVVIGPRMVGKTSLIKAANSKLNGFQAIYVNLWGATGMQGLLAALVNALNSSGTLTQKVKDFASRIEGLSVGPGGISVTSPKRPYTAIWDLLDLLGRQGRSKIVIELDEVQELSNVSGQFLKILANIWNTHRNIEFVFSGSMFGLIKTLLSPKSSKSPMYGRPPAELVLTRFDKRQAEEFLRKGFKEYKAKLYPREGELSDKIENHLDGIPGWLTLYGNSIAVRHQSPEKALKTTIDEGKNVVKNELQHFLEGREKTLYIAALKAMTGGGASWSTVKQFMEAARKTPLSSPTVQNVLRNLQDGFLIEHVEEAYRIIDPMLKTLILSGTTL
jgi:AAA+ ATPase superfamily predicted ATPase